jgi:hypothetical protein
MKQYIRTLNVYRKSIDSLNELSQYAIHEYTYVEIIMFV